MALLGGKRGLFAVFLATPEFKIHSITFDKIKVQYSKNSCFVHNDENLLIEVNPTGNFVDLVSIGYSKIYKDDFLNYLARAC